MTEIVYEPDGNVPPDFSCGGKIAVEVRRLNQHDALGQGLEETAIPLGMKFKALLNSLGPPNGASWFVSLTYNRPIEAWAAIGPKVKSALSSFRDNPSERPARILISNRFELRFARSESVFDTFFVPGSYSDQDSGGWIASEVIRNLAIVIPEKSKKIEPFRKNYDEWWLVLVDHVAHANVDTQELDVIRAHIKRPPDWSRIFLINPMAPQRAIEI